MSALAQIAESLRNEFDANLRAQRSMVRQQVGAARKELAELRADTGMHHTETTRALAHIGDEIAGLKQLVEPLVAARARRARALRRAAWLINSTPGLVTTATGIAGAITAAIALF